MICALAMLTAMMPSAVWAETPVPETTVITEEASTPTATPAATDSTEQPADNSGETPVASPLPTDQEQPATATDTGDAQPAETPAASPDPTATPVPTAEAPAEDDAEMPADDDLSAGQAQPAATPLPDATMETADTPAAGSNDLSAGAPVQTLDETPVTVPKDFIITAGMPSADIKTILENAAASETKVAQINAGTYESGFTVQGITLYVNGDVHVNGGISLKNATVKGLNSVEAGQEIPDKIYVTTTSEVTVNTATLDSVKFEVTGSVHNYLIYWQSGDFIVKDAYLSASNNTIGCGMFVGGGTSSNKFMAFNSELHFDNNVQGNGGSGIWANADGNSSPVFEFTGCKVTINNNGLNGFMGAPAPFLGTAPTPRFTFINTDVEACGNGSADDDGEGDGFSYGYITLKNTDGGKYTFNVSENDNNGLDGGRTNNAALNADGYNIIANGNGNHGLSISKLNADTTACTLNNCTVDASGNGYFGIYLKQPAEITDTTITANGNDSTGIYVTKAANITNSSVTANENGSYGMNVSQAVNVAGSSITTNGNSDTGFRFSAYSSNLTLDGASTLTANNNGKSGMYFYGSTGTLDGVLTATGNLGGGLYIDRGTLNVNNSASSIVKNNTTETGTYSKTGGKGGGVYNKGTVTLAPGVSLYNNHASIAGDDLYNEEGASTTFSPVGSDWELDDDGHAIDGWYKDNVDQRWNLHDLEKYYVVPFTDFVDGVATVTKLTSLKAAYTETAVLQPADMTIYMGGEHGYEGVSEENGTISGSNSLPEPGYYITLPDSVNEALKNVGLIVDGAPANLSQYLTIHTVGTENNYTWTLAPYGNTYSAAFNKYIYAIVPTEGSASFRLNFTDADGNVTSSDEFAPAAEGSLHNEYTMDVYPGLVDLHQVIIEVTLPDGTSYCCTMDTEPGKLNVRYVTGSQESVVTPAYTDIAQASLDDDATKPALNNAYVIKDADTRFFINGSDVDVNENGFAQVSLLFDDIVSNTNTEGVDDYATMLTNKTLEIVGDELENVQFQAKYLDLVDSNNGNVWLTPSKDVTIYWPYPEGTDANTNFRLVHFDGMDRDMNTSDVASQINNANIETLEVKTDEYGISFATDSFSPYVLVWGDTPTETTPDNNDESSPAPAATPAPTAAPVVATAAATSAVIPQTGDSMPIGLLVGLLIVAAVAFVVLLILYKRRKR